MPDRHGEHTPASAVELVAELDLPVSGEWQLVVAARTGTYERPIALLTVTIG